MKNLTIPTKKEDSIDLYEITCDFKGIIIVYNTNNPVGYIQYVGTEWGYYDTIDGESAVSSENTLYELIQNINLTYNATFKVIEFL